MERNKVIDECIAVINKLTRDNCSDHTPYYGACISCGRTDNPDILPAPDRVLEELENLKTK